MDELEADFHQYYNLDIAGIDRDKAARLMFQLPETSRVKLKVQPANTWGWSEMLLNKISYQLDLLAWQNTEDAANHRTDSAPTMYIPPFLEATHTNAMDPEQEAHTTDEIADILRQPRA